MTGRCAPLILGNGEHIDSDRSNCWLPLSAIECFVPMQDEMDDGSVVRAFDKWIE